LNSRVKQSRKRIRLRIELSRGEVKILKGIGGGGVQTARRFRRARLLLLMQEGKGAREAALAAGAAENTARRVAYRYMESGLEAALNDEPHPGAKRLLSAHESQKIVAMVCGPPPEGCALWSTSLIAQEAIKRKLVRRVGRETIRLLLLSHDLKPWREKNVVRAGDDG